MVKTVVFFATVQELAAWVDEWQDRFGLQVAAVAFQPRFELTPLEPGESVWRLLNVGGSIFEEVWLNVVPFSVEDTTSAQIRSNNRDSLIIQLPKSTNVSISESDIGSVSQNPNCTKLWRKTISDLKKKTQAGMWVLNRETRTKGFSKDKLYSAGIVSALKQGIRLTNITGLEVFVDDPTF